MKSQYWMPWQEDLSLDEAVKIKNELITVLKKAFLFERAIKWLKGTHDTSRI